MRVVTINSGNHGSVGKIISGIAKIARTRGYESFLFCPPGRMQTQFLANNFFIGTRFERRCSDLANYIAGTQGSFNCFSTIQLTKRIDHINPDIIHLHNLHSNYVNLQILFDYLKDYKGRIVWTFHDCWPFTGHCPHFEVEGCYKWLNECKKCPLYREYPQNLIDRSNYLFNKKKKLFTSLNKLDVVTPSMWLKNYVDQSFLSQYNIHCIANGIDLNLFSPTESQFREKYSIGNKFIILSVAFSWGYKKGLDRLENLANRLENKFQIVIVGIDPSLVKNKKIICIPRTANHKELAEIYTTSDVFLNPTREDTFPTVNLESLACGTPVLTYGAGGSAEAIDDTCGTVVNEDNVIATIHKLFNHNYNSVDCINRVKRYSDIAKFSEYVDLFEKLLDLKE